MMALEDEYRYRRDEVGRKRIRIMMLGYDKILRDRTKKASYDTGELLREGSEGVLGRFFEEDYCEVMDEIMNERSY